MAEIKFTGFVDSVKVTKDGEPFALRCAEVHYERDGDKFVVKSRTYRTVKRGWNAPVDFSQFREGDKVEVAGKELTETWEGKNGTVSDLVVKAESVIRVESGSAKNLQALGAVEVDADTPF